MSFEEIIDVIVHQYHASLYQQLPELSQYVTKIMRVHGSHHPELIKLHEVFHQFKTDMEQHATDEEQRVFPLILRLVKEPTGAILEEVRDCFEELNAEHTAAGNLLEQMRLITNEYELPEYACMTYQLTFKKLMDIENETFMHVHL